jgi:hypothetical protein
MTARLPNDERARMVLECGHGKDTSFLRRSMVTDNFIIWLSKPANPSNSTTPLGVTISGTGSIRKLKRGHTMSDLYHHGRRSVL